MALHAACTRKKCSSISSITIHQQQTLPRPLHPHALDPQRAQQSNPSGLRTSSKALSQEESTQASRSQPDRPKASSEPVQAIRVIATSSNRLSSEPASLELRTTKAKEGRKEGRNRPDARTPDLDLLASAQRKRDNVLWLFSVSRFWLRCHILRRRGIASKKTISTAEWVEPFFRPKCLLHCGCSSTHDI